jgi:hypothetical protein
MVPMDLVIDANIIKGFFVETVQNAQTELTGVTALIFKRLGNKDIAFLDDNGIIRHEWRNVVQPEWFDAWYPQLLIEGKIIEISLDSHDKLNLRNRLKALGFPVTKRDFCYIKTANTTIKNNRNSVVIISEDIDFFAPQNKGCSPKSRNKILLNNNGPVATFLKKNKILVRCVYTYCNECNTF